MLGKATAKNTRKPFGVQWGSLHRSRKPPWAGVGCPSHEPHPHASVSIQRWVVTRYCWSTFGPRLSYAIHTPKLVPTQLSILSNAKLFNLFWLI